MMDNLLSGYGVEPKIIAYFDDADFTDSYQYCVYLPVKMSEHSELRIPQEYSWLYEMINVACRAEDISNKYVYITVKHSFVEGKSSNRPGLHSDGFLTNDVNFIWYDKHPTEFLIKDISLTQDHKKSFEQMEKEAIGETFQTYPEKFLLRLDDKVIHKAPEDVPPGVRRFVKISISDQKYTLKGNSHNFLFDYQWRLKDRFPKRNCPQGRDY